MRSLICSVPVCPIRAEASHRSEQVSQLLFGEFCELLEISNDFVRVRVLYDNYEGWCQQTQLEETEHNAAVPEVAKLTGEWINEIIINGKPMRIPFGSSILTESDFFKKNKVVYKGVMLEPAQNKMYEELVPQLAYTFINTPYLWGGRSVFGIDCSGFTQLVFKCINIPILRDAAQQATQGDIIGFLQEVKSGDLAFFDNAAGKITHVGIMLDTNTIIHASGKVRVDTLDNLGIINAATGKRTHDLRIIKRYL